MERFTISLDEALASQFDQLIAARGYSNRSEAVRDLIRGAIESDRLRETPAGHCVANLSYVYNHHERELAERLTGLQHDHHDLTVAAMHSHLDHDNCLESVILKGATAEVRQFADALMAERGVRHGKLNLIALEAALVKPVVDALMALFRRGENMHLKHDAEAALREAIRELLLANPDENKAQAKIAVAKAAGILSEDVVLAEDMLQKTRAAKAKTAGKASTGRKRKPATAAGEAKPAKPAKKAHAATKKLPAKRS